MFFLHFIHAPRFEKTSVSSVYRRRCRKERVTLAALCIAAAGFAASALAGDLPTSDQKDRGDGLLRGEIIDKVMPRVKVDVPAYHHGHWEIGLESAYVFQTVPNVFFIPTEGLETNPKHYHLATQVLGVRYHLYDPCGPWLLRGTLEVSANLIGCAVVHGPEDYFVGLALGFRYYFVQPGARLVPYLEVRGGPGLTNSQGGRFEQQQDFTFTYMCAAGLRYDVDAHWSATISATQQHISNAGLTRVNYGFDAVGISLGVVRGF